MSALDATPTAESPGDGGLDWGAILAENDRWLRAVVIARLGERQALDEVMQEISLAAVQKAYLLVDRTKIGAWLYRVAVRTTLIYRRKVGRRRKFENRYADSRTFAQLTSGNGIQDPLGWVLRDEQIGFVKEAVARLARRNAEILLLKYSENWSYRELAEHLGTTESAVQARLHRARARLRNILTDFEVHEIES